MIANANILIKIIPALRFKPFESQFTNMGNDKKYPDQRPKTNTFNTN
ncbi:MAG: hypothetical protein WC140_05085 [Bacteroidales bacterium]